jgi:hypothetical protein
MNKKMGYAWRGVAWTYLVETQILKQRTAFQVGQAGDVGAV